MLSNLVAVFLLISTALAAAVTCNGDSRLCSRIYSNVTQIGTHDSAFIGVLPSDNQYDSIATQLDKGIRFLQAQTHDFYGTLNLCHTNCILANGGSLEDYFSVVKTWLDSNPGQVVTILLTNPEGQPITRFQTAMVDSGLSTYAYTPATTLAISEWPTLQTMIDAGERLVLFMDYGADVSVVPYILDEFAYFFETPYTNYDATFPTCNLDRPSGASSTGRMYIVNHFAQKSILGLLDVPYTDVIDATNAATGVGSIGAQAAVCLGTWGHLMKFVLVDFASKGDVMTAQNTLNHLS